MQAGVAKLKAENTDASKTAILTEEFLKLPPWEMHAKIASGSSDQHTKATSAMQSWAQQLQNDSDERNLAHLMTHENSGQANGAASREDSLLQVYLVSCHSAILVLCLLTHSWTSVSAFSFFFETSLAFFSPFPSFDVS